MKTNLKVLKITSRTVVHVLYLFIAFRLTYVAGNHAFSILLLFLKMFLVNLFNTSPETTIMPNFLQINWKLLFH